MGKSLDRSQAAALAQQLRSELAKVIVGQDAVVEEILIAFAAGGHALLEGVPGLAKTLLVSSLAASTHLPFHRIQFTPDLMPADITGTEIIREDRASGNRELVFVPGPIFASVILADEVNRAPPKTQAAMLEAMQERQVSAAGVLRPLPQPFFVLATQNPIEQEGTYPLPEAQLDRFLLKIILRYPSEEEELAIIRRTTVNNQASCAAVMDAEELLALQGLVRDTLIADGVLRYALALVRASRSVSDGGKEDLAPLLRWGAGPRAGQSLVLAAKARATLQGRDHVQIEDVRMVAAPVLRHRLQISYEAEARGLDRDAVVNQLIETVRIPAADLEQDPSIVATLKACP